jgi:hypothetical protein
MSGELFGVQLSADHTKGTTVEFNGLNTYDGASHMIVTPTGLTFPDATVQTTAFPGFAGYATESFVTSQGYITQGTADGLYYSISNPSGFITSGDLAGYATESFVTSQGYITSSALNGYATESWVYALNPAVFDVYNRITFGGGTNPDPSPMPGRFWFQSDKFRYSTSSSSLGNVIASESWVSGSYAALSGATFTGKVNLATIGVGTPSINLGGQCDAAPASAANGDLWISNATAPKLTYKMGGVNYNLPVLNQFNTFTNQVVIDSSSSITPTLRITQRGSGPTLVVEDSTTPDTSALVVDASGNLGVGVASGYTATQKVEVVGNVKADAFINGTGPTYNVKAIQAHSGGSDTHELLVSVNGSTYRVGMKFVSTP